MQPEMQAAAMPAPLTGLASPAASPANSTVVAPARPTGPTIPPAGIAPGDKDTADVTSDHAVFGVVAATHVLRLLNGWAFQIGQHAVPQGASVIGIIVAAGLSVWAFRSARE